MRTLGVLAILSLTPTTLAAQAGLFWDKPNPKPAKDESAISQLEAMTGQKIDRSKVGTTFKVHKPPPPPPPKPVKRQLTTSQQATATLVGGLFGALLNQALQPTRPSGPDPAELARLEAERQEALRQEQAELQAWANAYSSRMNALVDHQRQQRGAQNQESLEGLRASLSDGWDSSKPPAGGGGLAAALSDPVPAPAVVDLSESRTFTPSLLREANGKKRTTPVSADDLLKRREAAQARLKLMMEENKDLRVLGQRFYELEAELSRLKRQATSLGTEGRAIQHEMDFWGWRIEQATQACMERGTSLFTDVILPKGTSAGLKRLQKNPKLWNQTMQSFNDLNEFTEFTTNLADRYDAAGQALDWVKAKHSLMKNVDFIATNLQFASSKFEPVSLHWSEVHTRIRDRVSGGAGWGQIQF